MGVRVDLERIAAPKTLEPVETPWAVRGRMECSMMSRYARRRSEGLCFAIEVVGLDMLGQVREVLLKMAREMVGLVVDEMKMVSWGYENDSKRNVV